MGLLKTYTISTDITAQDAKASKLHKTIVDDSLVSGFHSVLIEGDSLKIYGDSIPNEADLNSAVQNHDPCTLDEYKNVRYPSIDKKTGQLIALGFTYDGNTFSLSINAQANWNALKDQQGEFIWPVDITTIDNNTYSLAVSNIDAFWTAAKDTLKGHLDSGRALKKSIFDATTKAEVDAVVDNR